MNRSSSQRQPSQGGEPPALNDRYRSLANSFHRVAKQKDEQLKQAEREVQELRAQLELAKQQQQLQQQQHPVAHIPYPARKAAPHEYSQQPAPQSSRSGATAQAAFNGRRTNDMVPGPDQTHYGAAAAGYMPQGWGYGAPSSDVGRVAADSAPSAPGPAAGHSSGAEGASKATRMGKLLSISSKLLSIKPKKAAEDGQQQQLQQATATTAAHSAVAKHDLFAAPNPAPAAHQPSAARSAAPAHPAGAPVREVPPQHRLWDANAMPSAPPPQPTLYPPPPPANPPPRPSYYASGMMSAAAAAAAHGHRWQQATSAARSVTATPRAEPAPPSQQPFAPPPPAAPVPAEPVVGLQHPWAPLQPSGQTVGLAVTLPSAYLQAAPPPQPAAASKWQKAAAAGVQQSQQQQQHDGTAASVAAVAKAVHGSDLAPGRYGSSGVDLFAPSALAKLRQQQQQQQQAASGGPDGPDAADGREGRAPDTAATLVSNALLGVGVGAGSGPVQNIPQGAAPGAPPAAGQVNQPHVKGVSEGGNVWAQLIQRSNVGQVTQRLAASTPGSRRATDSTGVGSHGGAAGQQQPPAQRLQPQQSIGGHSVASTRLTSWGSGEGVDALAGAPQGGQPSASRAQGAPPSASLRAAAAQLSQLPPRGKPPVPGSHRSASNAGSIAATAAPPSPHSPAPKPHTPYTPGAPSMPTGTHASCPETAAFPAPSPYAPSAPPLEAAAGAARQSPTAAATSGQSPSHPNVASNAYLVSILTRLATPQVLRQSGNDVSAYKWALGQSAAQGAAVSASASTPPTTSASAAVGQCFDAANHLGQAAAATSELGRLQGAPAASAAVSSAAPDAEGGVASTEAQTTLRRDFARRAGLAWRQKACYANAAPAAGFMERTVSMRGSGAGATQETTGGALQQHGSLTSPHHHEVAGAPRAPHLPATQVARGREPRPTTGGDAWDMSIGSVQEPVARAGPQSTTFQAAPLGAHQAGPQAAALQAVPQHALQAAPQAAVQQAASMATVAAGSVSLVRAAALWRLRSPRAAIGVSPRLLEAQRGQQDAPPQHDVSGVKPVQAASGLVMGVTHTPAAKAFALSSTPPAAEALHVHREQSPALGTGSPSLPHPARRSPRQEVQEGSPGLTRYGSADVCDFELTDSAASNSPAVATAAAEVNGHLAANMTPCFPGVAMHVQADPPTPVLGAQAAAAALSAAAGAPTEGDAATPRQDVYPTHMATAQHLQSELTSPRGLQQGELDCSPGSSVGSWQPPNIGSPRPHCSITRGATGALTSPRRLAKPVFGSPAGAERGFDAASTTVTPCAKLNGLGVGGAAAAAAAAAAHVAFGAARDTAEPTDAQDEAPARVGAPVEEPGQLEQVPRRQSGSPDGTVYGSAVGGQQSNPGLYCSPGPRHVTSRFDSAQEEAAGAATPEEQATPTFWLPTVVTMSPAQWQEGAVEASPSRFVASSVYESPVGSAGAVPSATFMPRSVLADAGEGQTRMQSLDDACTVEKVLLQQQQQQQQLEALRLEQAATNIQAAWRGHCARVAVAERARQQREEEGQAQRLQLEMEAQAQCEREEAAAVVVQLAWRGHCARVAVADMAREQMEAEEAQREREQAAAVVVQAAWRGRSARIAVTEMVRQQREEEAQRERAEAAAVVVQAAWRGRSARVTVAGMVREQREAEEAQRRREEAAAVVVQAAWRGHSARVAVAEMVRQQQAEQEEQQQLELEAQRQREEAAAVVVQSAWRGHQARVAVGEMVRQKREEEEAQRKREEAAAVVVVQSAWRGHQARVAVAALVRQRQEEEEQLQKQKVEMERQAQVQRECEEAAAVVVQAAWRGYSARVAVAEVVRKRREEQVALAQCEREGAAAVVVQAAWRGHQARVAVAEMVRQRQEEEQMQRRQQLELQAQRECEEAAAVVVQSAWRGHCARVIVAQLAKQQREEKEAQREREEAAAVVVQSAWRGYTARAAAADMVRQRQAEEEAEDHRLRQLEMELAAQREREEAAAVVVQSAWRGHCARVAVAETVKQRQAKEEEEQQRRRQLEMDLAARREREEAAAVVVQAAWRGHRARVVTAEMASAQQEYGSDTDAEGDGAEAGGSMQGVVLPLCLEEVPIGVRVPQLGVHRHLATARDLGSSPPIVSEGRVTTLISEGISIRFPAAGSQTPRSPDPSRTSLAFVHAASGYGSPPAPASPRSSAAALPAHRPTPHTNTPAPNSGSCAGSDTDDYDSEPEVQGQERHLNASPPAGSVAPFSAAPQGTPPLFAVPALTRAAGDSGHSPNSAASRSPSMASALASWGMRAAAPASPGCIGVDRGSVGGAGTPRWSAVGPADCPGLESEESEDGVTMFLKTLVDVAHQAATGQIAPDDPQLVPLNEVLSDPSPAGAYLRDQLGVLLMQQGLGAGEQQEVGVARAVGAVGGELVVGRQGGEAGEGEEELQCSSGGSGGCDGLGEEACSTHVGMGVAGVLGGEGEDDGDEDEEEDGAAGEEGDGDDSEADVKPCGAASRQLNRFALLCGSEEEEDEEGESADGDAGTEGEDEEGHSVGEDGGGQEPSSVEADENVSASGGELLDGGEKEGEAYGGNMAVVAGGSLATSVFHETPPQAPMLACPSPAPVSAAASSTPFSFGAGGLFGGALATAAGGGAATPTWPGSAVGGPSSTLAPGSLPAWSGQGAGLGGGQPLFGAVGGLGTGAGQGAAQPPPQAGLFGGGGTFGAPLFGGTGAWGAPALQGSQAAPAFGASGNIFGPPALPTALDGAVGGPTSTAAPGPSHPTPPAAFAFGSPHFPAAAVTPVFGATTTAPEDPSSPSVGAHSAHSTPRESSPSGAGAPSYNTSSVFVSALGDSQAQSHLPGAPGALPVAPTPMSRPRPQPTTSDTFISYNNSNTTTLMYGLPYGSGTAAPGAWGGIGLVTGASWAGGVGAGGSAAGQQQQQPTVPGEGAEDGEGTPPRHMRATSSPSVNGQPTGTPGGVEAGRAWPATARTEGYRTHQQQQVLPYGGETPCSHRVGGMWGAGGATAAPGTGMQNGLTGNAGALPFRLSEPEDGETEGSAGDGEQGRAGTGAAAPWRPAGLPTMRLFNDDEEEEEEGGGEEEGEEEVVRGAAAFVARGGRFALLGEAFGGGESEGDGADESALEDDGDGAEEEGEATGPPGDGVLDRGRTADAGGVRCSSSGLGEAEGEHDDDEEEDEEEAEARGGFAGPVASSRERFALLCSDQSASDDEGGAQRQGEYEDGDEAGEIRGDEGGEAEAQEAGFEWWRRHGGSARYGGGGGGGGGDRSEGEGGGEDEAFCSVATSVNEFGSACSSRRVSEGSSGRPQG